MAKEVGYKLKESKSIDKFIFLIVSRPPDFKKIRGELAKGLDLSLQEVKEEELSSTILSRITKMDKKLLIILDDVWEKFDLIENLGIPSGHKGCNLLITTRSSYVCKEMGCQVIDLHMLNNKEALKLFEAHANMNNSTRGLKGMPEKIVTHCGGIPVAIVAIARALKNQPAAIWKDALKTLEDRVVDQNLEEACKCLKLSYDNLKNRKSKELFLISSLFPEDWQVPIQVLTKIGTALGSFGENDRYHLARSEVHGAIMELIDSSLLLHGQQECVKMHDLVREVALWIGDRDIQSLIDLKMPVKESLRYLLWKNDDFPNKFEGSKLEVLLLFLDGSKEFKVSGAFFKEMMRLKVLVLFYNYFKRTPALSWINSLQALKDIRTLILENLDLGDISISLGNLLSVWTIGLYDCSINELPSEFLKLNKLRSLELEGCEIEKNNPFEVIKRCSQLEELTFVANRCENEEKDAISEDVSPLTLHRYCISSKDLSDYFEKYGSMSRCVRIDDQLSHLVSEATFKQLVRRAELLMLEGKDAPRIWKNSILDDIVATDDRGMMNDLIVLHLSSCPHMEFPIDTKDHDSGVAGFCNLVGIHLSEVGVEDLHHGPLPSGVWEQLEIMKLNKCHRLKSILSNGNYNLCHLKSMKLEDCPMLVSVFQPSTARSLMKLEKLTIRDCSALEYIIVSEDRDRSNQKSYHDSLFPKLKKLRIARCSKLRIILPILFAGGLASLEMLVVYKCEQLEYIFDKFQEAEEAMLPSLKELELLKVPSFIGMCKEYHPLMGPLMQKPSPPLSTHNSNNINQSPARRAFSWVQACCSLNKSRPASEDTKITVSEQRPHDRTIPLKLDPSICGVFPFHIAQIPNGLCSLVNYYFSY
ncbi:probable disease resistance protein At1g61300 [Neltuma alba]|uniref:probable disease resistance protein At1g61300 n=1 Tax=Neltuma alba TaxID=207710 RepID=UPI0010A388CC|nr:probable disease resistance protein At1g61300 [Prosopis alba]